MSKNSAEFSESKKENTNIEEPQERKECTKIEESQIKDGEDKKENILKSRKFLVSVNLGLLIMAVIVTKCRRKAPCFSNGDIRQSFVRQIKYI